MRSRLLPVAAGVALGLLTAGCQSHGDRAVVAAQPSALAQPTHDASPSVEPSQPGSPSPSPSPTKAALPTYDVKAVETELTGLGYYGSAVDGVPGPALSSAVMAFQKVQGLGADGVVGKATLAALKAPRKPSLKATGPSDRVEVDLTKQVLYVVRGGAIVRILPVSSGNGATYFQKNGRTAKALTPVGWYRIQRRYVGPQVADLGTLYDPQYFYEGWAIHGSNSVPAYPASHGCIRVTRADATYLLQAIHVGTSVYVYGGSFTFTAGSAAPGTDNPTGDTSADAPASPSPSPSKAPASPQPSPKPSPQSSPSDSPSPSPVAPQPSPTRSPAR